MDGEETELLRKRIKPTIEKKEGEARDEPTPNMVENEETDAEATFASSEEMELAIAQILDKIEHFTQLVSELLESGKTMFKEISKQFEEQLITTHKEQMENWQEEIKELRFLDSSNEAANAILHNARYLLQNSHIDT